MASAAVGIPLLLLLIWQGRFWVTALSTAAAMLALWEFCRLSHAQPRWLYQPPGFVVAALLVLNAYQNWVWPAPFVMAALALLGVAHGTRSLGHLRIGAASFAMAGPFYVGATLAYAPLLRGLDQGSAWLTLAVFATFAVDTSAYFVGRALGRHRMAPRISPGKTWEGAAGGVAGGLLGVLALSSLLGLPVPWAKGVLLGLGVAVVAQAGDLLESALKRAGGAKDAGRLIPGHGGLLDRLDSILFSLVLVYYGAIWATG